MAALLRRGLPARIRQLRINRGWTQAELATSIGTTQARVALIEKASSGRLLSLATLLRVAESLDMALVVQLRPLSEFLAEHEDEDDRPAGS